MARDELLGLQVARAKTLAMGAGGYLRDSTPDKGLDGITARRNRAIRQRLAL
ncbi:hypothetical protein [Paracoccus sp. IB05]|uniref:hypothetical protein n=1 Tax=Paracoccus sp. IB05 TaxID=2779367 RepID=UPI0018E707A7|nr:hypothetical protein [Paracoccus sp. IB05]MBJ2150682.1 hypothetical protein [Paracoccus sp. IB05]